MNPPEHIFLDLFVVGRVTQACSSELYSSAELNMLPRASVPPAITSFSPRLIEPKRHRCDVMLRPGDHELVSMMYLKTMWEVTTLPCLRTWSTHCAASVASKSNVHGRDHKPPTPVHCKRNIPNAQWFPSCDEADKARRNVSNTLLLALLRSSLHSYTWVSSMVCFREPPETRTFRPSSDPIDLDSKIRSWQLMRS